MDRFRRSTRRKPLELSPGLTGTAVGVTSLDEVPRKRSSSPSTEEPRARSNIPRTKKEKGSAKKTRSDEIPSQTITGSPLDPFPRKPLRVKDLDLHQSYVGKFGPVERELPARQKRWKHEGSEPLLDQTQVPKGWNSQEPDLARDDIDGHIQRCHERIEDNILPYIFERRLVKWEAKRDARDEEIAAETSDLSWNIIKRLKGLALMKESLQQDGDKYQQLVNVTAVENAYRSGTLDRTPGLVVYFSKGKQLCQPRPFVWEEFEALNKKYHGESSFWTEGLNDTHATQYLCPTLLVEEIREALLLYYNIAVRAPGANYYFELDTMHDTGASCATIYNDDLVDICGPFRPDLPVLGLQSFQMTNGVPVTYHIIELEMAVVKGGKRISPYLRVPTAIAPSSAGPRVDGPFGRYAVYTATKPDGLGHMLMSSGNPAWRLGLDLPYKKRPTYIPLLESVPLVVPVNVKLPAVTPKQAALAPKTLEPYWGIP